MTTSAIHACEIVSVYILIVSVILADTNRKQSQTHKQRHIEITIAAPLLMELHV